MNKYLRSVLAAAVSAVLLAGCAVPGSNTRSNKNDMTDSYSYTPNEIQSDEQLYSWLIKPSIQADNIISFDASRLDPEIAKNKSYMNYSVIRQSGRYGLIDYAGNMIIKPEYDDYYICRCGEIVLFNAIDERRDEYEYCTIDTDKQISTWPEHLSDDYPVYYMDISTQKIFQGTSSSDSVKEYTGKKSVAVTEANVELNDYGSFVVSVPDGALCGMANNEGLITECIYDAYYAPTYKGSASTCIAFRNASGKWGYLDSDGNVIIDFICDGDPNAYNGMITDDQMVSHPYLFCDDYIPVYKDGYYSYYDLEGDQVVRAGEFGQARPVNNGRAWVKQNDFWGVIQLGEIIEEEKPKEDSSSKNDSSSASSSWTTTTTASDESGYWNTDDWTAQTDEYGNPVTSYDPNGWTDPSYTDTDSDYGDWTDPGYTDTGSSDWTDPDYSDWTDPAYTEPPVSELPDDYYEY